MLTRKSFYFIRHGETDWNIEGRFQGQMDIPMNQNGIEQAYNAQNKLAGLGITHIYSSPLLRARRTADILNENISLPIFERQDLMECSFGELEGTIRDGSDYRANWSGGKTPRNAETYIDFTKRVVEALEWVLKQEGVPLIVSHGAVFWPIEEQLNIGTTSDLHNAQPILVSPPQEGEVCWSIQEV